MKYIRKDLAMEVLCNNMPVILDNSTDTVIRKAVESTLVDLYKVPYIELEERFFVSM